MGTSASDASVPDHTPGMDGRDSIDRLERLLVRQKAAFARDPYPGLETRQANLAALAAMTRRHADAIVTAMSSDFGCHPEALSLMVEVHGVAGRAEHAIANVARYMTPDAREVGPMFGTATAAVRYQPKGVIGNIAPWNFPFDIALGPLVDMLAAGNRAVIKPSEITPACSQLIADMVADTFAPDLVAVVQGGPDLARAFSEQAWDHLVYTGSPAVGRQVMMAAARNLVPVTLELGGKCPAILTPGSVTASNVGDVIGTKLIKNGQMCISVDYVLVPRADLDRFVSLAIEHVRAVTPNYSQGQDCTGLVSERHFRRIIAMIEQARAANARLVQPEDDGRTDLATRRMPLTLVIHPEATLDVMQEEIFGPILPVVAYDGVDDAIAHVNARERPLGIYVFGDRQTADEVIARTHSGGATVNCCAVHGALPSMGFGGIGASGMGRHHGIEGFREFSNARGVFVRGEGGDMTSIFPPYPRPAAAVELA